MSQSNAAHRLELAEASARQTSQASTWTDQAAAAYTPGGSARRENETPLPTYLAFAGDEQPGADRPQRPAANTPARPRDVGAETNRLIAQLGDDLYATRESASRDLFALGPAALPRILEVMDQVRRPAGHRANNPDLEGVCNNVRNSLEVHRRLDHVFARFTSGGAFGGFADVARSANDRDLPYAERTAAQSVLRGMRADHILDSAGYSSVRETPGTQNYTPMTDQQVRDLRRQLTQLADDQLKAYVNEVSGFKKMSILGGLLGGVDETKLRRALVASVMLEGQEGGTTTEQTAKISAQLGEHLYRNASANDDENSRTARREAARAERYLRESVDHLPAADAVLQNLLLADLYRRTTEQNPQGRATECMQALQQAREEIARQMAAGSVPRHVADFQRIVGNIQSSRLNLTAAQRTQLNGAATEAANAVGRQREEMMEQGQQIPKLFRNIIPIPGMNQPAAPAGGVRGADPNPGARPAVNPRG